MGRSSQTHTARVRERDNALRRQAQRHRHGQTGDLVYRAFKRAQSRGARLGQLWMSVTRYLQYLPRVRLRPDVSIDVTTPNEVNWQALQQHISQGPPGQSYQPQPGRKRYEQHIVVLGGGT